MCAVVGVWLRDYATACCSDCRSDDDDDDDDEEEGYPVVSFHGRLVPSQKSLRSIKKSFCSTTEIIFKRSIQLTSSRAVAADREICVSPQTSGARSYANLSRARVARAIYRINFVGYAINLMVTNNKQSLTFHQTSTLKFLSQVNCPSCERKRITRLDNLEQHQRSTTRTGRRNDGGNLSGGLGHVSLKILFYFYLN